MTTRRPCPPARVRWRATAPQFPLWRSLTQRCGFRDYLTGLLRPRHRNKTITALVDAEPVAGSKHPAVQRMHWYLTEAAWDPQTINDQQLRLLRAPVWAAGLGRAGLQAGQARAGLGRLPGSEAPTGSCAT
jgi:hypothetical protein